MLVVVIAIGILSGVALERLLPLVGKAEHIAFLQVRSQLQSALLLRTADLITRGDSGALAELGTQNPMELLLQRPDNYLGSLERPGRGDVPARHWYFDPVPGRLVYRIGTRAHFDGLQGAEDRIEFEVRLAYRDGDGDGTFDARADRFEGMRLESVHAFSWPE